MSCLNGKLEHNLRVRPLLLPAQRKFLGNTSRFRGFFIVFYRLRDAVADPKHGETSDQKSATRVPISGIWVQNAGSSEINNE